MTLIWALLSGFGGIVAATIFVVANPEKVEKWSAAWWRLLSGAVDGAHKKYVKHDLQGRVNLFTKRLRKKAPDLHEAKLRLEWIDENQTRESFIADGQVVIRLKRNDPQDHNFVYGVHHYISTVFLHRAKTYLTKSQSTSVDIFTCTKFFETEKPEVVEFFLQKYLHPITQDRKSKVTSLIMRFEKLYDADIFFPIFVQEMQFLGYKVFGKRRDDQIHKEVASTIDILESFADRRLGEETDSEFLGRYCKFAIVIAGKAQKIQVSVDPYVKYLSKLLQEGYESLYLLSPLENKNRLEKVCVLLGGKLFVHRYVQLQQTIHSEDGDKKIPACLFVIRSKDVRILQPSN